MRKWLFRAFAVLLVVSLAMFFIRVFKVSEDKRVNDEAAVLVGRVAREPQNTEEPPKPTATPNPAATPGPAPQPIPEEAQELLGLKINLLQAVNPDVIGWLEIPGTTISYPLMQGEDNHHYLEYNWKNEPSISGSVFMESTNNPDFSDYHTIIYGHRMLDDSMFGVLRRYSENQFWKDHQNVYIVTENDLRQYKVFAAHEPDIESIVYRLNIEEKGMEQDFIDFCLEKSTVDTGIIPDPGDKILTLSTYPEFGDWTRWVVHAVLVGVWEK